MFKYKCTITCLAIGRHSKKVFHYRSDFIQSRINNFHRFILLKMHQCSDVTDGKRLMKPACEGGGTSEQLLGLPLPWRNPAFTQLVSHRFCRHDLMGAQMVKILNWRQGETWTTCAHTLTTTIQTIKHTQHHFSMAKMRLSQQQKRQKKLLNHQLQTGLFAQTDWCLHPLAAYDNVRKNTDSI